MGKRLMITISGYADVPGNLTDEEAIEYGKQRLSASNFNWEKPDFDTLEVVGDIEDAAPIQVANPIICTLVRIREENLFRREIYTNDFMVLLPEGVLDITAYADRTLRAMAHHMLTGKDSGNLLRGSCSDFNWGDFVMSLDKDTEEKFGCYSDGNFPVGRGALSHIDLQVSQDEVLLTDDEAVILIAETGSGTVYLRASADMSRGAVGIEESGYDLASVRNADKLYIRFNGRTNDELIPVAASESAITGNDDPYYWLAE